MFIRCNAGQLGLDVGRDGLKPAILCLQAGGYVVLAGRTMRMNDFM